MSPEVTAAVIAAGVSVLTLIGTLAAQYFGRRATSKQLDRTFGEQRTRTLNERFATAAEQVGSDKPAVRLAGVYAMAGLADDWDESRQTCVDVLCAYLRMPYEPDPGQDAPQSSRLAFEAIREVRHTVIRVITTHLKQDADVSWRGLNFDLTGVLFDGGDFRGAGFSGATVNFTGAEFCGGTVSFAAAEFSGATVYFADARFSGGTVDFGGARFSEGWVYFAGAQFSGGRVSFRGAQFSGGAAHFGDTEFAGCTVDFRGAQFSGGTVFFGGARFSDGIVDFTSPSDWSFPPTFPWTDTPPSCVKLPKKADRPAT
jgi:Pentapeptide repeats (9 copies)